MRVAWRLGILGDVGGFGIGSDLAWQINPFVGYQFQNYLKLILPTDGYPWTTIREADLIILNMIW